MKGKHDDSHAEFLSDLRRQLSMAELRSARKVRKKLEQLFSADVLHHMRKYVAIVDQIAGLELELGIKSSEE